MYETPRKKGRPLTENERNLISHLLRLGHTQTDIAKVIGVYPSTICRELRRGEVELLNSDKWIFLIRKIALKCGIIHQLRVFSESHYIHHLL